MSEWKRSYETEGTFPKGNNGWEWWNRKSPAMLLSVYNMGDGWKWRISAHNDWKSLQSYNTKEEAFTAVEQKAAQFLAVAVEELKPITTF